MYDPRLLEAARDSASADSQTDATPRDAAAMDATDSGTIVESDVEEPTDSIVRLQDSGTSDGSCRCNPGEECCNGRCVDVTRSTAHCGGCNTPCPGTTCSGGTCTATCRLGFGDCDMNAANGCETDLTTSNAHCGRCGAPCSLANADSACVMGTCTLRTCNAGYGNCDTNAANGCEADLNNSVTHCRTCGNACTAMSGMPACSMGVCGTTTCAAGRGNCDGNATNGCETDLNTTATHCGACGRACSLPNATTSCVGGACRLATCNAGFGDCDGNATNGCETPLATSTTHCGACGRLCAPANAMAACVMSACSINRCDPGFANCDTNTTNGCEADTNNSAAHCGGCGRTCAPPNASPRCTAGTCGINACNAGFANCDASAVNGCETATATSATHCGRCGNACGPGSMCVSGVCENLWAQEIESNYLHTCVRRTSGAVACWGYNIYGQLGDSTTTSSAVPVATVGLTDAVDLALGSRHTCARRSTSVVCWGYNISGQLGNGTTTNSPTPVVVSGISTTTSISAGYRHTCVSRGGPVSCWGYNVYGQLGNNSSTASSTPVTVTGITDAVQVAAGYYHTCARRSSGAVVCWGYNTYGQLGNGTTVSAMTPVAVVGLSDATSIDAGQYHTCARRATGAVVCWGYNSLGQLGNGTMVNATTPVAVTGLTDASSISAGYSHTCARRATGAIVCWGNNASGQLGNGTMTASMVPVTVPGIGDALDISSGSAHTCARRSSRSVMCWGSNGQGQLGTGVMTDSPSPAAVQGLF
ncbi:MAG: hypothetical protein JNK05_14390 [Myxococcales bacterium]|nr:hypothetical protein [Myxococcales bacterium]